jgi:hypothetical protein
MQFIYRIAPAINVMIYLICLLIAKHCGVLQYF